MWSWWIARWRKRNKSPEGGEFVTTGPVAAAVRRRKIDALATSASSRRRLHEGQELSTSPSARCKVVAAAHTNAPRFARKSARSPCLLFLEQRRVTVIKILQFDP